MARTFSSMDLLKTARNAGMALRAIITRPNTSTGITITKVVASLPPMI